MEQKLDQILSIVTSLHQDFTSFQAETAANFAKVWDELAQLNNRFNDLNTQVGDLSNQVSDLNTQVGDLSNQVSDLYTQVGDLYTQVNDLNTQVGDLTNRVNDLTKQVSDLTKRVSNLEQELTALSEETTTYFGILEKDLGTNTDKMRNMEIMFSTLHEKTNHAILLIPSHYELKNQVMTQQDTLTRLQEALNQQIKTAV